MSRSAARTLAFKLNYLYLNNNSFDIDLSLSSIADDGTEITDEEREAASSHLLITKEHIEDIKTKISSNLKNTSLSQVYSIDYAILVTAIAEIDYMGADKALVINEAVNIAKRYSTDNGYAFINGFLSGIYNGATNA